MEDLDLNTGSMENVMSVTHGEPMEFDGEPMEFDGEPMEFEWKSPRIHCIALLKKGSTSRHLITQNLTNQKGHVESIHCLEVINIK